MEPAPLQRARGSCDNCGILTREIEETQWWAAWCDRFKGRKKCKEAKSPGDISLCLFTDCLFKKKKLFGNLAKKTSYEMIINMK